MLEEIALIFVGSVWILILLFTMQGEVMIKMNEEELKDIEELIERKLLLAEVMGGLTSYDKKFIDLYNYVIQLQNNWNELKKWCKETIENVECTSLSEDYLMGCEDILKKMQELEGNNDN